MSPAPRFAIGRVPVDGVTLEGAVERIVALAAAGSGGTVYTPNADHIVVAEENEDFRRAYESVSLSLVDGTPVFWALRALGYPVPEKVSGSDLFEPLVARAAREGLPIYLLGGQPGVAERARDRLVERYPALRVVGWSAPRIDAAGHAENEAAVLEEVCRAEPALVFVACGAPKSELFAHRVAPELAPAVLLCVGAAIDFAAGTARRAPAWMSRVGLEWAYRLAREPRRLATRYLLRDPKFFWIFGKDLLAGSAGKRRALPEPRPTPMPLEQPTSGVRPGPAAVPGDVIAVSGVSLEASAIAPGQLAASLEAAPLEVPPVDSAVLERLPKATGETSS